MAGEGQRDADDGEGADGQERQARALRKRWLIAGFNQGTLDGTYWSVASAPSQYEEEGGKEEGEKEKVGTFPGYSKDLARSVIEKAGYGETFGHALGHGVGLAVHEEPRLARGVEDKLVDGMVFTIEPGIYITGRGGVRIEDIVVMENGKARLLSHAPKRELQGAKK